jgi:hypothetical protein
MLFAGHRRIFSNFGIECEYMANRGLIFYSETTSSSQFPKLTKS